MPQLRSAKSLPVKSLIALVLLSAFGNASADETQLPRRFSLGTKVQPVSEETQQTQNLPNRRGVEILETVAGSNAESIGLKAGDVIVSIGGKQVEDVQKFVPLVGTLRSDKPIELKYYRGGKLSVQEFTPKELPRESVQDLDIEYGAVSTKAGKLRTVLTAPKATAKAPAIMLLSGLGNAFVEHPSADPTGMKSIAYQLSRKGFVVLRVEKPGCGDSEGGPAQNVEFDSVVEGYVEALKQLKKHSRVDAESVWLFGASMGGVQAALVAAEQPVQGLAIYGTMVPSWKEFLIDSTRRQMLKSDMTAQQIEAEVAIQAAGWHYVLYEGLKPDDLAVKHQELMDWVDATWAEGKYFSGIHYKFFQQAGKADIAKSLESFDGKVLSMWGEADIVTSSTGHQWIAEVVNRKHAGKATYMMLPGLDHNLRSVAGNAAANQEVSPIIIDKLNEWIRSKS